MLTDCLYYKKGESYYFAVQKITSNIGKIDIAAKAKGEVAFPKESKVSSRAKSNARIINIAIAPSRHLQTQCIKSFRL